MREFDLEIPYLYVLHTVPPYQAYDQSAYVSEDEGGPSVGIIIMQYLMWWGVCLAEGHIPGLIIFFGGISQQLCQIRTKEFHRKKIMLLVFTLSIFEMESLWVGAKKVHYLFSPVWCAYCL